MQAMVLSIIGADKLGLVDEVASAVAKADGNWLRSSFCHLSGHFAGFVEIMLPKENHSSLVRDCHALSNLQITLLPANEATSTNTKRIRIKVTGNDRKGIVSDVTSALTRFDLNIVELDTKCESAPNWGNLLFSANIVVETSENIDTTKLRAAIEGIADDLMVDLKEK
ncbi:amino acid-binding ACT [Glaciecola punicea ACAM 611]|jgi:glycine cleavage system regulatory protein|uniref:Glycine cleavage system transcriptional repressor n=1 Tax=Glaciecola punicea ACAM 611 TaxID=1121923 RepID=H5TDJ5_9ALTE|nr:ACT domain-containing protein [Glaciecola punicea]OFA32408.1 amino acid-binding protein [Glaciecola punicea]GAB56372.1 amino acid-binding ACT [Glaciecola punicea ACAM 611]